MGWLDKAAEIGQALAAATREHVDKALAVRDTRIAALERQVAELKASAAKHVEAHNSTVASVNSLERRASRHAEHLAHLETRVRVAERGTGR